jgi:speckle-type POZ protein
MHLICTSIAEDAVHGKVKLSLPGHAGERVPLCSHYDGQCTFTKFKNVVSIGVSFGRFVERAELERSRYLKDDCFTVWCDLTVFVKEAHAKPLVKVPPPVLQQHLCQLLSSSEASDVSFKVGRETFAAHRCVLAARSSVFKAELFGPMRKTRARSVTIEDMQPAVFRAFLHFIYTDSLPDLDDLQGNDHCEMIRHLLVAADRYAMDRLKMLCQNILGNNLDVENVATTLALADQHNCVKLKDLCVEFLASSDKMDDVVATQGYANLKRSCPSVLIDALEKRRRSREA